MPRAMLSGLPLRPASRFALAGRVVRSFLFLLFLATALVVILSMWSPDYFQGRAHWPEALLVISAAVASAAALTAELPVQNVLLGVVTIFATVFGATLLNTTLGIPLGDLSGNPMAQKQLLWIWPSIWVSLLLTGRGVARFLLRPWRDTGNYGVRVLGATILISVLLQSKVELLARINHYWSWKATRPEFTWFGTPVFVLPGWTIVALIAAALSTPALIEKSPARKPVGPLLLWMWLVLEVMFVTGAARGGLWGLMMVILVEALAVFGCLLWVRSRRE